MFILGTVTGGNTTSNTTSNTTLIEEEYLLSCFHYGLHFYLPNIFQYESTTISIFDMLLEYRKQYMNNLIEFIIFLLLYQESTNHSNCSNNSISWHKMINTKILTNNFNVKIHDTKELEIKSKLKNINHVKEANPNPNPNPRKVTLFVDTNTMSMKQRLAWEQQDVDNEIEIKTKTSSFLTWIRENRFWKCFHRKSEKIHSIS